MTGLNLLNQTKPLSQTKVNQFKQKLPEQKLTKKTDLFILS